MNLPPGPMGPRRTLVITLAVLLAAGAISSPTLSESRSIPVGHDASIFVEDTGPTNRRPAIVLIPGWGSSSQIWRQQAEMLEPRYRIIHPRSQGRSTIVNERVTPEQRAHDLEKILASLQLDDVVVGDAGHALFVDQLERFSGLLSKFLIGLPDQPKQQ